MMSFFLFLFGLSVGSFLNVLIDRLPQNESILGRSRCDHCRHKLFWYDLIPLLSFFLLQRRCRYCKHKLSWQYPVVELITAILFVFTFMMLKSSHLSSLDFTRDKLLTYQLFIISGLIVIFFTDLKYRIIPDQIVIILVVASSLFLFINHQSLIINHLLSAIVMFLVFLLLVVITRGQGMGLGDVKFAFLMGFLLGFPKIIIAFYLAFLTGAILSIILVIGGRKSLKSTIPFGPFLVGATVVSLFYGESLWEIFRRIIGV